MATQIVMDHTGDTRHAFDPDDAAAVAKAEYRFQKLISSGYTAATRNPAGEPVVTRAFDPKAGETVFYPRLVGG
jgi:hypothetical protein